MQRNALASPAKHRIAFCHIGNLTCLPALNTVFGELGDDIGLVLSSRRFGSKHGSFWRQAVEGFRRSGVPLNVWLGFEMISVSVLALLRRWISAVGGRPPALATLQELARRHNARLVETTDVNSDYAMAAVEAYAPDFIVVMNFDQILRPPLIALAKIGTVNVHPSLLPALRGPCPVLWALAQRRQMSGATVHVIEDQSIDAGRVLERVEVPIDDRPSMGELNGRLFLAGALALPGALAKLAADRSAGQPQILSEGEYLRYPSPTEMASFRRSGLRLCQFGHVFHLIAASLGVASWKL